MNDQKTGRFIDFIKKGVCDIEGLKYSEKGYAVFDYETIIDELFNIKHTYNYKKGVKTRAPNRNNFIIQKPRERVTIHYKESAVDSDDDDEEI